MGGYSVNNWLVLHQKVAAALIVAVVLIVAGPYLKAQGIDLSGNWQTVLAILAAYMAPGGTNVPSK